MAVILELKGVRKPHQDKKTINSLLIIMMDKASNKRVGGPPGVNISDGFGGVMAPGSKALASVDNNSSGTGGNWRQLVVLQLLLNKFGHKLGVW